MSAYLDSRKAFRSKVSALGVLAACSLYFVLFRKPNLPPEQVPRRTLPRPFCPNKKAPLYDTGNALIKKPITSSELPIISNATIHFLTYGSHRFKKSLERILREARSWNRFATTQSFRKDDLSDHVKWFFEKVLAMPKGNGYWLWKIFITRRALIEANDGDYIFYVDAGSTLNKNGMKRFDEYLLMLHRSRFGILSFVEKYPESKYTSGRILEAFDVIDNPYFVKSRHIWAGAMLMKKHRSTVELFDSVVRLLHLDMWIITDEYRTYRQPDGFHANRHDQSILSIARKCTGSVLVFDDVDNRKEDVPVWATRIRE